MVLSLVVGLFLVVGLSTVVDFISNVDLSLVVGFIYGVGLISSISNANKQYACLTCYNIMTTKLRWEFLRILVIAPAYNTIMNW